MCCGEKDRFEVCPFCRVIVAFAPIAKMPRNGLDLFGPPLWTCFCVGRAQKTNSFSAEGSFRETGCSYNDTYTYYSYLFIFVVFILFFS